MYSATAGLFKNVSLEFKEETTLRMWRKMCESRYFNLGFKKFLEEKGNTASGAPFYLSLGQEAVFASLATVFPEAIIVSQIRCHGVHLAWGGDPEVLADELVDFPMGCAGIVFLKDFSQFSSFRNSLLLVIYMDENISGQEKVAELLDISVFKMTDDPWLIMHAFKSLGGKFPAVFNIYICSDFMEWDRFELVRKELDRIGLGAKAGNIEIDAKALMNGIWNRRRI